MRLEHAVKPISYVKSHAAELVRDIAETGSPIIITQNGEAKAVLQDIREYEQLQESLAMLKILALSRKDIDAERVKPREEAFADIRGRIARRRKQP